MNPTSHPAPCPSPIGKRFAAIARLLAAATLAAGLAACGPSAQSLAAASKVAAPAGKGATIKVYRSFTAPAASAARIHLDDAFLGYVSARSQNTFHVKPGTYRLVAKYPPALLMMPDRSKPFTIREGETLHFGIGFSGGGELLAFSDLRQLDAGEAGRANERFPSRE
jgi:hypothetical protein